MIGQDGEMSSEVHRPHVALGPYDARSRPVELVAQIERWVESDALRQLVGAFDERWPDGDLAERLEGLADIARRRWDFRAGRERNFVVAEADIDVVRPLVREAAEALGLVRATLPTRPTYTHLLILGGLVRACILRPWYVARLLDDGVSCTDRVSALGAFRVLAGNELDLLRSLDLADTSNEFEAMDAGVRLAFDLDQPCEERFDLVEGAPNMSAALRRYAGVGGPEVLVIAAPSADPARRANTADTYRYWAEKVVDLRPGDSVLLVTSAIYVPYQHANAIRMLGLPFGAAVETVGVDTAGEGVPDALRQEFLAENYLQEVGSAINGMCELQRAVVERT